jgi:acetylornithine/N-succinyldiaminopimelate aminotransferase
LGAMVAKNEIASSLTPGSHGTTFGGNPVSCAAGLATIEAIDEERVLENATRVGAYLIERLREVAKTCDRIKEVRGLGMIIGVVLKHDPKPVVDACLEQKLLVNGTAGNVLRMLPPLNLSREDADKGLAIIERALRTAPMAS